MPLPPQPLRRQGYLFNRLRKQRLREFTYLPRVSEQVGSLKEERMKSRPFQGPAPPDSAAVWTGVGLRLLLGRLHLLSEQLLPLSPTCCPCFCCSPLFRKGPKAICNSYQDRHTEIPQARC